MKTYNVNKKTKVLGLMSGTSLDGVDVACIETDGLAHVEPLEFSYFPYSETLRAKIRACFGARVKTPDIIDAELELTLAHINAVKEFMAAHGLTPKDIHLIGFHGQTITHDPDHQFTWQLGAGDLLARETGIDVVYDFRTADVAAGGQGAPLIPIYHWARAFSSNVTFPVAILNIGGVSNVTWLGRVEGELLAFDCGPGNALIDDIVLKATGERFDKDGAIALSGKADPEILSRWLSHPFFGKRPPKSLDRGAWDTKTISNLPLADAVATLTDFTVAAIAQGATYFPEPATAWYVTGGGRLNAAIMQGLRAQLKCNVKPVEALGWNGDALEAEGFAYLAVRSVLGLPLSYPTTTGVVRSLSGGKIVRV
jgi:anhydro-N-acetylmuramic acid kinase